MNKKTGKSLKALLSINFLIGIPLALFPEEIRLMLVNVFDSEVEAFLATTDFRTLGCILTLVGLLMTISRKILPPKYQDMLIAALALINAIAAFELTNWLLEYEELLTGYLGTLEKYGILGLLALSLFVLFRSIKYLFDKYVSKRARKLKSDITSELGA